MDYKQKYLEKVFDVGEFTEFKNQCAREITQDSVAESLYYVSCAILFYRIANSTEGDSEEMRLLSKGLAGVTVLLEHDAELGGVLSRTTENGTRSVKKEFHYLRRKEGEDFLFDRLCELKSYTQAMLGVQSEERVDTESVVKKLLGFFIHNIYTK